MEETERAVKCDANISAQGIYIRYIKRCVGCILAGILLVVLLPIYLSVGLAIYLDSGFPIYYRAYRGGYQGRAFRILKFRTMIRDADKLGGGTTALKDRRITKVGNFLRKSKLDEIPQLINIIKGEMSFVGPRPELLKYTQTYSAEERNILSVRPGITDFGSVELVRLDELVGYENADEHYEKFVLKKKNALRIKYVEQVCFRIDVYLFLITISIVVKKAVNYVFDRSSR